MANYSTLKAAVADVVKTNGSQAITGANLQTVLLSIINSIGGGGYIFNGVATPSTDAGTPDQNVFYIGGAGTYANFGTSVVVPPTNIAVFKYNGTWTCEQVTVENGGVFDISAFKAVGGTLATYADLAAALGTGGANVPANLRRGGMSVKYVQSSDNKYVQFRYMGTDVTGNPNPFLDTANWQGVDDEPTAGSDNLVKSGGVKNELYKLTLIIKIRPDDFVNHIYYDDNGNPKHDNNRISTNLINIEGKIRISGVLYSPSRFTLVYFDSNKDIMLDACQYTGYNSFNLKIPDGANYLICVCQSEAVNSVYADVTSVDEEPTADSENLVKSGGVKKVLDDLSSNIDSTLLNIKITPDYFVNNIYYNDAGVPTYDQNRLSTRIIRIDGRVNVAGFLPSPSDFTLVYFDSNKNIMLASCRKTGYQSFSLNIPDGASYLVCVCQSSAVASAQVNITGGSLASENTCGIANDVITHIPESIFTLPDTVVDANTGKASTPSGHNYASTDFIPINDILLITYTLPFSSSAGIVLYDEKKEYIKGECSVSGQIVNIFIPESAKYFRLSKRSDQTRNLIIDTISGTRIDIPYITTLMIDADLYQSDRAVRMDKFPIALKTDYSSPVNILIPCIQQVSNDTIVCAAELPILDSSGQQISKSLILKRSSDNGQTWNDQITYMGEVLVNGIISDNNNSGNPVLVYDNIADKLFIFYQQKYRVSLDKGATWTAPLNSDISSIFSDIVEDYPNCFIYPSPANGIQLQNGVIALVYRVERAATSEYDMVCVVYSADHGETWHHTPLTPLEYTIDETALVEYEANRIMLNARGGTEQAWGATLRVRRVLIQSNEGSDNAAEWSVTGWEIEPISDRKLMEPVCQASLHKAILYEKEVGLFLNPFTESDTRENLLVRVSSDFKHWSQCFYLTHLSEHNQGYTSITSYNNNLIFCMGDEKGIYACIASYEVKDKIMRTYGANKIAYLVN